MRWFPLRINVTRTVEELRVRRVLTLEIVEDVTDEKVEERLSIVLVKGVSEVRGVIAMHDLGVSQDEQGGSVGSRRGTCTEALNKDRHRYLYESLGSGESAPRECVGAALVHVHSVISAQDDPSSRCNSTAGSAEHTVHGARSGSRPSRRNRRNGRKANRGAKWTCCGRKLATT